MGAKRSIVKENKNGRQNSQNAEKRSRKRKNPKAVRQLTAIYVALVLVAAGAIGGGVFWAVHSTRVTEELIAENTQESTTEEESTVPAAIEETEETRETEPETETETETEMLVELTEDNIRLCKSGILQNCAGDGNLFGKGVGGGKAGER